MAAELAGRGSRLGAVLIDLILGSAWILLLFKVSVNLGHEGEWGSMITDPQTVPVFSPPTEEKMFLAVLGLIIFLVYVLLQILWLSTRGQTIGKRMLGIKIVRTDGKSGGFLTNVLLRYIVPEFIYFIPLLILLFNVSALVGLIVTLACRLGYPIVDALMIFSKDKRCIHDHIAGTQVVKA